MEDDLNTWATTNHDVTTQSAIQKLQGMPMASNGKGVAVPFPFVDRSLYKKDFSNQEMNRFIDSAPIRKVSIEGLSAIQHSVKRPQVERYLRDPSLNPKGLRSPRSGVLIDYPIVVRYKGKMLIYDGHHRLTSLQLKGKSSAKVRFVDLDSVVKV